MCQKCGCNTYEAPIQGPLLTEGKVKSLISENLQYHIDKNIPLFESIFRIGSNSHLSLIKEARKLYSRNLINLSEDDTQIIKTHLGEFAIYEGESVPLDLPMLEESKYHKEETIQQTIDRLKARIKDPNDGGNVPFLVQKIKDLEKLLNEGEIEEAEFKGKDVKLNKPKRGGPKAYYVYVRDPKTKRIKKVTFGSGGLKAKIRNKKARNAFSKRHRCPEKKDRTKASYWSCNLPRYASMLGLGANMNTFW